MPRLKSINIDINKLKIEDSQFKRISYYFAEDFTATQTAKTLNISRQTINHYYKIFRKIIAINQIYIEKNELILNIRYLKIYDENIFLLQKKNQIILLDKNSFFSENINYFIQNELKEILINHKKANSVRILYNKNTKNFTILGYFISNDSVEKFIYFHLKKFRGIRKETLYFHIKESFFRFNNTNEQIYKSVLNYYQIS
jgi:transposase-like protein